jgi:hypothetical protein
MTDISDDIATIHTWGSDDRDFTFDFWLKLNRPEGALPVYKEPPKEPKWYFECTLKEGTTCKNKKQD